jgi:hypothetical protein
MINDEYPSFVIQYSSLFNLDAQEIEGKFDNRNGVSS